jgi:molybdate transport system permease protein
MRALLAIAFFVAITFALGFMVLPVVAIFVHVPPSQLLHQFSNQVVIKALEISVKTSIAAQVAILLFGTPTAWFLASRRFRGRPFVITLVELPIVLPPAVAGLGLIVAFGRFGLLGSTLRFLPSWIPLHPNFNETAVVFAVALVAGPFYVRQGIAAFEAVDPNLVAASRTLGAGSLKTFFRVTIPLARAGLAAGLALSLARGLGEFGATIMFAGSFPGRTETLPLAVYTQFESQGGLVVPLAISALLVIISLAILLTLKASGLWTRARPVFGGVVRTTS